MSQPMIVTNIRMPQADYRQIKSIAGELGISVNAYIRSLITGSTTEKMMAVNKHTKKSHRKSFYDAILSLAHAKSAVKKHDVSADDAVIYET